MISSAGMNEETRTPPSLCHTCAFVRLVHGRRRQTYYLCRNEAVPMKYPPQPVNDCEGYEAAKRDLSR